jgi:hypothetical protein
MSDLFGVNRRGWLAEQQLPSHEPAMVDACLRHLDFLDGELKRLDRGIAHTIAAARAEARLPSRRQRAEERRGRTPRPPRYCQNSSASSRSPERGRSTAG